MAAQFTTIGHSNRPLPEFLGMLQAAGVGLLADVRHFPRSRSNPEYNIDRLPQVLAPLQIGYHHFEALGGRRSRQRGVDPQRNALWRVQSFHNYADYALGAPFQQALAELVRAGTERRVAIMCAEAVWWRCHRRIITDWLLLTGHPVDHLLEPGDTRPASPTPGARLTPEGMVVYPAAQASLNLAAPAADR